MVCVFDVNETLLDLSVLDEDFERLFGDKSVRIEWFNQFLQSAFVSIITNTYKPFGAFGAAAFDMVAERQGKLVTPEDKAMLLGKIVQLPAHADVIPGLHKLQLAGIKTATLTNSTAEVAQKQLEFAGLSTYFDKILSSDAIKQLKPAKATYELAAREFNVDISEVVLVAAHSWDIAGAKLAGMQAALVRRNGITYDPSFPAPDFVGSNIDEVVQNILQSNISLLPAK